MFHCTHGSRPFLSCSILSLPCFSDIYAYPFPPSTSPDINPSLPPSLPQIPLLVTICNFQGQVLLPSGRADTGSHHRTSGEQLHVCATATSAIIHRQGLCACPSLCCCSVFSNGVPFVCLRLCVLSFLLHGIGKCPVSCAGDVCVCEGTTGGGDARKGGCCDEGAGLCSPLLLSSLLSLSSPL